MIKRIVWTIILFAPVAIIGLLTSVGITVFDGAEVTDIFNAGNIWTGLQKAWEDFMTFFNEDKDNQILDFFLQIIVVAFFVMPFIFVWRGLFFVGWIPFVGLVLRIICLIILIALPGVIAMAADLAGAEDPNVYIYGVTSVLVLLGIWLPKKWTA